MVRHGREYWDAHPHVGNDLTLGERSADLLKKWFGTWTALFAVGGVIAFWVIAQMTGVRWDPYPYILLNLVLSCIAAVQGIVLQISANRGDRIAAEVALHTQKNTDDLMEINQTQLQILNEVRQLRAEHESEEQ